MGEVKLEESADNVYVCPLRFVPCATRSASNIPTGKWRKARVE